MEAVISSALIDPANTFTDVCRPYTEVPAWWSGFLFHVLSARHVTLYMYLNMLGDATGICHPTTKQIRQDLGLSSLTIVFESLSVLETRGFILRQRRKTSGLTSRQNVYQRPACEFTILRLLEQRLIDGLLRPTVGVVQEMSEESRRLKDEWLEHSLGRSYDMYRTAPNEEKRGVLMHLLRLLLVEPST